MRSMILTISAVLCLSCSDSNVRNPAAPADRSSQAIGTTTRRRAVTHPPSRAALSGEWGGEHIALELQDGAGRLELDCAHGSITQAIVPAADGTFSVLGTFTRESGGPVPREGEDVHPARYSGKVSGDRMDLTIAVDGTELADKFVLVKNQSPRIVKCL